MPHTCRCCSTVYNLLVQVLLCLWRSHPNSWQPVFYLFKCTNAPNTNSSCGLPMTPNSKAKMVNVTTSAANRDQWKNESSEVARELSQPMFQMKYFIVRIKGNFSHPSVHNLHFPMFLLPVPRPFMATRDVPVSRDLLGTAWSKSGEEDMKFREEEEPLQGVTRYRCTHKILSLSHVETAASWCCDAILWSQKQQDFHRKS